MRSLYGNVSERLQEVADGERARVPSAVSVWVGEYVKAARPAPVKDDADTAG